MALVGVGVDILEIDRMERALKRTPRIRERLFSADERAYCDATNRPAQHYAARFAAHEAILKALGTGFSQGIGLTDISITHDKAGRPQAKLSGRALEIAHEKGIDEVAISLSFTREVAVANAVAVTPEARPARQEAPDPRKELQASFKDARSLIDELERVQESTAVDADTRHDDSQGK